jgi:putative membrane protein
MPSEEFGKDSSKAQQHLANERTFLSWLRTSIALIGLGFIIARFVFFLRELNLHLEAESSDDIIAVAEYPFSSFLGLSIVVLGIGLIIFALKNYRDGNKEIERGAYVPKSKAIYIAGITLATFSGAMLAYLIGVSFL